MLLNNHVKAQLLFLNNPSNHIVLFNPAFSAIRSGFNNNYIPKQINASFRVAEKQSDFTMTGQYYFLDKNLALSAHYNYINQKNSNYQIMGIGVSHHLIFFNEVSTGWGISLNYNTLQTDSNTNFSVYNETRNGKLQNSNYASLNFGGLINYDRLMLGFSYQPKQCIFNTSNKKGTNYSTGSIYLKYKKPISRNINATIWYNANWNSINNLQTIASKIAQDKIQSHALNVHVSGKRGIIAGIGCRITDFNYTSFISKLGFNAKKWQIVYGIEPYWMHAKYSEIIHELSFTFKI